jgi:hypothetical protein
MGGLSPWRLTTSFADDPALVAHQTDEMRLVVGNRIRCPHPRDLQLRPIFAYKTFEVSEDFEEELNIVLKCPCGHIFSPGVDARTIRMGMQVHEAQVAHAA